MISYKYIVHQTDLSGIFNNDNGRVSQTSNDPGEIIYNIEGITDFIIEYWQWNNAEVTGSLKVYAFPILKGSYN